MMVYGGRGGRTFSCILVLLLSVVKSKLLFQNVSNKRNVLLANIYQNINPVSNNDTFCISPRLQFQIHNQPQTPSKASNEIQLISWFLSKTPEDINLTPEMLSITSYEIELISWFLSKTFYEIEFISWFLSKTPEGIGLTPEMLLKTPEVF